MSIKGNPEQNHPGSSDLKSLSTREQTSCISEHHEPTDENWAAAALTVASDQISLHFTSFTETDAETFAVSSQPWEPDTAGSSAAAPDEQLDALSDLLHCSSDCDHEFEDLTFLLFGEPGTTGPGSLCPCEQEACSGAHPGDDGAW